MKSTLQAIAAQAAELQAAGAIRTEHDTKWQALRVAIDQAADQADQAPSSSSSSDQLATIAADVRALREAAGV